MPKMKNGITLITPTGDRPMAFKLCEQWMSRQTVKYDQWIIIDDGKHPTIPTMGQEIYRLDPQKENSICRNIKEALKYIKYNKVVIIEDDDYYTSTHLESYLRAFKKGSLVGQGKSLYYNVKYSWFRENLNMEHASLCQTGFKSSIIKTVEKACDLENKFLDHELWSMFTGKKVIWESTKYTCVGIKGLPGRAGTASGHEPRKTNDKSLIKMKKILGEDYIVYLPFMQQEEIQKIGDVPAVLFGSRIKQNANGNYWIAKANRQAEKYLDSRFERLLGSLEWRPFSKDFKYKSKYRIVELKKKYKGLGYLVGKGPSLDDLTEKDFSDSMAPIICINESIHKIESLDIPNPIFCIQQDAALRETCWSKKGAMLLSYITQSWYHKHPNVYGYSPREFGLDMRKHPISAIMALQVMAYMGIKKVKLHAFDSIINKDVTYAECVGYAAEKGGDPNRFLKFARWILEAMKTLHLENVE